MNEQTSAGVQPTAASRPGMGSVSDLFKKTWEQYSKHAQVLIGIMLIAGIGLYIQTILLFTASPASVQVSESGSITMTGGAMAGYGALALVAMIIYIIGMIWGYSALLNKINKLNEQMGIKDAYMSAKPLILPLLLTGLLTGIFTLIGLILLVIPGIIVGVFLSMAMYVVVAEGKKGMDAVKASKAYVDGYWWSVFGRILLMTIVIAVISGVIGSLAQSVLGYKIGMLIQNVIGLALTPFAALFMYNMYLNLRQIKGGSAPAPAPII